MADKVKIIEINHVEKSKPRSTTISLQLTMGSSYELNEQQNPVIQFQGAHCGV